MYFNSNISEKEKEYVSSLMKRCELGDVAAMEELASFYYEDHPDLIDDATAQLVVDCYEKAAAAGNEKSRLNLGTIYYAGKYAKQDYEKAIQLFSTAASGNNARIAAIANAKLGDCYSFGNGTKIDHGKAFDCYLEGVLLCEHPVCLYKLGDMYREGKFVSRNCKKAYFIYEKAKSASQRFANDSYAEILVRLAEAKIEGLGTERDIPGALKYLGIAKRTPSKSSHPEDVQEKIELLFKKASEK